LKKTPFHPYEQVRKILEQVLAASPADETEVVWFERRYGSARHPEGTGERPEKPALTVLLRVVEGGRLGWYRTETPDANLLESGVRQALALATGQPKVGKRPLLPTEAGEPKRFKHLFDRRISRLEPDAAGELLADWCDAGLRARLGWSETRLVVANSHGLRRRAATTEVSFEAVAGEGPGAGRAAGSGRVLEHLRQKRICERARRRRAEGDPGELPAGAVPVLFTGEAVIELLNVLNTFAFSGRAFVEGTSFLARHRNVQVFDRSFNLCDDGTRTPGLPFPIDLEGSPKAPLDLIVKGQPSTPALTYQQGVETGLVPTAQSVGGQDALFGNLFLLPGETGEEELLAAADGGIHVGWLDRPECFYPGHLHLRARARGVRRIEGGRLGAPLPELVWEDSLLRALARLRAVGRNPVVRAVSSTPLGAISAPALVLTESEGFRVL